MRYLVASTVLLFSGLATSGCGGDNTSNQCTPNAKTICKEGVTYWADSCGNQGDKAGDCDCGCNADFSGCKDPCDCVPDCGNRECGLDPVCGISCGDCGNHGTCDDSSGAAICTCGEGYAGERCAECAPGYHDEGGTCVVDEECLANTCSGNGTCDDSSGAAICTCDEGYSGERCAECAPGYHDEGDVCVADEVCLANTCSGHGICDDTTGVAICTCDVGYVGAHCETCDMGYQDNDGDGTCLTDCSGQECSGHGTCDDSSGAAVCFCDVGYTGAVCDICQAGYQDNDGNGTCLPDCSAQDCSGHGTCDDSSGMAVCSCNLGYTGVACETCDTGYQDNDGDGTCLPDCSGQECSGHGTCDDFSGAAVCFCDVGYTGTVCDICQAGYQDSDGNGTCLPDCSLAGLDCGLHETCDDSLGTAVCVCDAGYTGAMCDTCDTGYQDNDGNGTCLPDCSTQNCSGHGTCDDSSGTAVCGCDAGWGGLYCSIEWVAIPGGTFMMGSDTGEADEQPVHEVTVPAFEMNRTEVTVAQYQACVDDVVCTEPDQDGSYCYWGDAGREDHPVNCVNWFQAVDFCSWMGGRLPSEAEWEYAARGGGQDITYPWGDDPASCTFAVMYDGGNGCGMNSTWAVCGKPAGNTAQGLCDMAGNVSEWVQDWYHSDYNGAPSDGSAWEDYIGFGRVIRDGGFGYHADALRAANRSYSTSSVRSLYRGFRCARDAP